jgi:hypothetical protein
VLTILVRRRTKIGQNTTPPGLLSESYKLIIYYFSTRCTQPVQLAQKLNSAVASIGLAKQ